MTAAVHNFMPAQPDAPLAPGAVAALYGSNLAPSLAVAPGGKRLPTQLNAVTVLIGGEEAPVYFTSNGQVNVQVPPGLQPDRDYQILVSTAGALTQPATLALAKAQPGVAALPDGTAIAQHSNPGSCRDPLCLVSQNAPARAGGALVIYLGGMGATSPTVVAGDLSPGLASGDALARVAAAPTVTVDGRAAEVLFAGLTPGLTGLYQINFKVPSGVRPGDCEVVVTQGSAASNRTRIWVRN